MTGKDHRFRNRLTFKVRCATLEVETQIRGEPTLTATEPNPINGYHVKVDPAGRVVVPAAIRARYNIHAGDTLVIRSLDNGMELQTYEQLMRDAQDYFCSLVPAGRSLANELIEERRRESEAE
jgi:AbrB family looped-hinge helix DNA binding protein